MTTAADEGVVARATLEGLEYVVVAAAQLIVEVRAAHFLDAAQHVGVAPAVLGPAVAESAELHDHP